MLKTVCTLYSVLYIQDLPSTTYVSAFFGNILTVFLIPISPLPRGHATVLAMHARKERFVASHPVRQVAQVDLDGAVYAVSAFYLCAKKLKVSYFAACVCAPDGQSPLRESRMKYSPRQWCWWVSHSRCRVRFGRCRLRMG